MGAAYPPRWRRTTVLMLALIGSSSAEGPVTKGQAGNGAWSALDKVPQFLKEADGAGFSWQEGQFSYIDLIKETCEGRIFCAMGNNPWPNAYFNLQVPNPKAANYNLPYPMMWQMNQDEAMVIIGQTPPLSGTTASRAGCSLGLFRDLRIRPT
jgi:hypothetical protein